MQPNQAVMNGTCSFRDRLVGSPCCLPEMAYAPLFAAYREIGFTKFEAFSIWVAARHNETVEPIAARAQAAEYGLAITSYHLPKIERDIEAGLAAAVSAARYAARLGEGVAVLFKADTKDLLIQTAPRFLDAIEREHLNVIPVVQNHKGSAISTLEDFRDVLRGIDDPRMKAVLEVGHFHRVGVKWQDGWDLLSDRIALIHVNDIRAGQSVPFGTGEVDLAGLMKQVKHTGYAGNVVVELELATHATQPQLTIDGLRDAANVLCKFYDAA
jgi:sugar phosphate isomerase/epimerase